MSRRLVFRSIAVLFAATLGIGTSAANAAVPDPPPIPDCTDSVYASGIAFNPHNQHVYFKVVGVDLRRFLGNAYGTAKGSYTSDADGTDFWGPINASPNAGFRTASMSKYAPNRKLSLNTQVLRSDGSVACRDLTTFTAPAP